MAHRAVLAVHAHPDDETITMGGTLARYAAAGVRTIVLTCTTGDLATVFDAGIDLREGLAAVRQRELEAAARCLGVSRLVQLGYGDSGMPGAPENQRAGAFCTADVNTVAGRIAEVLRVERPQVLVTYDETGGYGHPDHQMAHRVAVAAFAQAAGVRPLKLYFVRIPRAWSREFVRTLRSAGIDAPASAAAGADAGPDVREIGTPDHLVTTTVDVRPFIADKRLALACHASQFPPDHFLRRMPASLAEQLWAREFFSLERSFGLERAAPEAAPETDLFAGVR